MKIITKLVFYFTLFNKINFFELIRKKDRGSNNIIILWPSYPKGAREYFLGGSLEREVALLNACISNLDSFKIQIGIKGINNISHANVFYTLSRMYRLVFPGDNYADSLHKFVISLEENNNKLFLSMYETALWENKLLMHSLFENLDINCPPTMCISKGEFRPKEVSLQFPILYKPAHSSGSVGIKKLNTIEEFDANIPDVATEDYLIQEWIDMDRDLRLIYVGDELIVHYWRINEKELWTPTSTGHGSKVDFGTLPTQWMDFIFCEYKKLNLTSAAFDITWPKNDLSKKPFMLEVSPSFMPNPKPSLRFKDKSYTEFKKSIFGKGNYNTAYINLLFDTYIKIVQTQLKNNYINQG